MQPMSLKMRFFLFLYSTKNLVGSALAIAGLGLFFGGVITDWWLLIVITLYAIGWLAMPGDKEMELKIRGEATQSNLTDGIAELINESKTRLPHEAVTQLERIHAIVTDLGPRLFVGDVAPAYVISIINAVMRDLPETVKNYIRLPSTFASLHVIDAGKTSKQLFLEQLDILCEQLSAISLNVYKDDADALVVNGKFLQEKFRPVSFLT